MAAGLPVIITQNIQTALIVKEHQCGKVVEYDIDAISKAIAELLEKKGKFTLYVRNAINVSKNFDWNKLMDEFYKEVKTCIKSY